MAQPIRVLVVDDSPSTNNMLCESLRSYGFIAIPALGGIEGVQKARTDAVDCMLLDIMMDDFDGIKVCRELRQQPATKDLPIIILSAKKDQQDIDMAREAGATDYFSKPASISKLIQSIQVHVKQRPQSGTVLPGQTIVFFSRDGALASQTQAIFDTERTGGKNWFHISEMPLMDRAKEAIAEGARAVVIDARSEVKDTAAFHRQIKMTSSSKAVAIIALIARPADDVKFAWANECLVDPVKPRVLAEAIKKHLK